MNEELNDHEIQGLERQLRSYGDPYASPEPDERYFANFRARVMERVAEEPKGFGEQVRHFFFGSPLRMTFTGGSLVAATLLYFFLQSPIETPVAQGVPQMRESVVQQPEVVSPQVVTPAPKAMAQAPENVIASRGQKPNTMQHTAIPAPVTPQNKVSEQNTSEDIAQAASEFETFDELSMSSDDEPVSYDRLSMEELEVVLKTLESEPVTIE